MALHTHTYRPSEAPDCAGRKKMGAPPIDHRQDVGEVQTVSGRDPVIEADSGIASAESTRHAPLPGRLSPLVRTVIGEPGPLSQRRAQMTRLGRYGATSAFAFGVRGTLSKLPAQGRTGRTGHCNELCEPLGLVLTFGPTPRR